MESINFKVTKNDIIYLSGENGAGKSTLLKLLSGIIQPDHGEIFYYNKNLKKNPSIKKKIGYMTTESMFYENLSVIDNLKLVCHLYKVEDIDMRLKYVIDLLKMDSYKTKLLSELSSGMRRKVQISAGIIHDPEILLFDEPFNTLDESSVEVLAEILKRYTVVFTSHDMELANSICNRKLILSGNTLMEDTL